MKLRQICDSPAILNEEEKFENHSIKLDELGREIVENIGDHKALVFPQFPGYAGLIKAKLPRTASGMNISMAALRRLTAKSHPEFQTMKVRVF